jgi:hypothetical protein
MRVGAGPPPSRPKSLRVGPLLWVALPLGVLAGSSPTVAQRAPRLLFPILGAVGAVLLTMGFVNSLVRLGRRHHAKEHIRIWPALMYLVLFVGLVIMPLTHLKRALAPIHDGAPLILATFGDWFGAEGYPRLSRHRGLDIKGRPGADVLAAADGRVTVARDNGDLCGLIVVVDHDFDGYRTVYCHFAEIAARVGDRVKRGQRIGAVGTSGQRAWPGFEHVHLELQRGRDINAIEDPLAKLVGCFRETTPYKADRLVLTYPVKC